LDKEIKASGFIKEELGEGEAATAFDDIVYYFSYIEFYIRLNICLIKIKQRMIKMTRMKRKLNN
jgi:hypothetical protein